MLKKTIFLNSVLEIRLGHFTPEMFVSEALLILCFCKPWSKQRISVFYIFKVSNPESKMLGIYMLQMRPLMALLHAP